MKRIAAFILLLLYSITSTGATLHYHYCMGEMANSSLWADTDDKCGKCGMEKSDMEENGCCKDKQQWIKIEDDQKYSYVQFKFQKQPPALVSYFQEPLFFSPDSYILAGKILLVRCCLVATYVRNCVFLI